MVVQPVSIEVEPGKTVSFSAEVYGTGDASVEWSVVPGGGAIGADGRYTAPAVEGDYEVVATSRAAAAARGSAVAKVRRGGQGGNVTPTPAPAPTISTFSASPTTIEAGQSTTLSWSVADATSLTIEPDVGPAHGNSTTVSPTMSTTYTLTATGNGTASATVTVTVGQGCQGKSFDEKLQILATKKILFTHASIGGQIIDQLERLDVNHRLDITAYEDRDDPSVSFASPSLSHVWYEDFNEYGDQKLQAFDRYGRQVGATADAIQMKFCYTDFNDSWNNTQSYWDNRWVEYRDEVNALKALYPNVRIIHWTAPIVQTGYDSFNPLREYFSNKIRATYPARDIFDLADVQSRDANGQHQCLSDGARCQHPAWDGADHSHMNDAGNRQAAEKWVDVMACPNG